MTDLRKAGPPEKPETMLLTALDQHKAAPLQINKPAPVGSEDNGHQKPILRPSCAREKLLLLSPEFNHSIRYEIKISQIKGENGHKIGSVYMANRDGMCALIHAGQSLKTKMLGSFTEK